MEVLNTVGLVEKDLISTLNLQSPLFSVQLRLLSINLQSGETTLSMLQQRCCRAMLHGLNML
jgi:hypothetical protein